MSRGSEQRRERLGSISGASTVEGLILRALDRTVMPAWAFGRDKVIAAIERRNGIHTAGIIAPEELGIAHPERCPYSPAPWSALRRVIPTEWVRPDDVFVDLGSGMGRVVFQAAAQYPFRRVIGVELSQRLHEIAEANIERNHGRLRCQDVQLVNADVLDYQLPDDVTFVFMFNPFTGQTFAKVIDKLLASVDRNPRWLRIVYVCPQEHDQLMATGRARQVKKVRRPRPVRAWADRASIGLYDLLPTGIAEPSSDDPHAPRP
jgi:hypothetical protein